MGVIFIKYYAYCSHPWISLESSIKFRFPVKKLTAQLTEELSPLFPSNRQSFYLDQILNKINKLSFYFKILKLSLLEIQEVAQ